MIGASSLVMRGLVPRTYPVRPRHGVWAPRRVDLPIKCAGDEMGDGSRR
jgi:hypothetical protein